VALNQSEAYDLAIKIIKEGKCSDSSLEENHIQRNFNFDNISEDIFHISIERHPHLFCRTSKGIDLPPKN